MRRVAMGALLGVGAGSSLTVFMHSPWQLDLLWGVVNGLATGAISVPLAAMIANRWFVERRGLVTGFLTASSATGNLVFLPVLAWIIVHHGWRSAVLTISVVAFAVVLPLVALFLRERPVDKGIAPFGGADIEPAPAPARNPFAAAVSGLGEARRDASFWLLAGSFFICGLSTNGLIGTHLIPAAMDHGFGEVAAASLLATIGVFDIIGTTCSGWLTDRYDPRILLFWYYGLRGLSLLALPYAFNSPHFGLILFVVFYGLDWVATVPPTVALTAEIFGRERVGVIFGWIFCAHMFGASFAAWGAGAIRTWFGGYGWAFGTAGLLCLFASGLVMQIERGPRLSALPAPA
jgi:MFS family permease